MKAVYENRVSDYYYRSGDKLACGPHLHYHIELVYIKKGGVIAYVDTERYEMKPGDFLFVPPNKIHYFDDIESHVDCHLFIISPDLVPDLKELLCSETILSSVIQNSNQNSRLEWLMSILSDVNSLPELNREIIMRGYLNAFFGELLNMLPQHIYRTDDSLSMKAIIQYCSQNFTRDLSLSVLEEELHLSKYYISHLFSSKLGIRFNDYINSLRISDACRYLRTTSMSVTDIAVTSGFGTLRTFNRAFRKKMNISPSTYRKNIRTGNSASILI